MTRLQRRLVLEGVTLAAWAGVWWCARRAGRREFERQLRELCAVLEVDRLEQAWRES